MKLTIIHTTLATLTSIPNEIYKMYGNQFQIVNVLDDSLLNEIKEKGCITKEVIQRFVQYCVIAENNNSDAILLACSSIGEAGTIARNILNIPLLKIDEPMAKIASKGKNILVLGTVNSTLEPSCNLVKSMLNSSQKIEMKLIPNTFELYSKNKQEHDMKIAEVVNNCSELYDTIILAQASMVGAKAYITNKNVRILTSMPLGLEQLSQLIER